MTNASTIPVIDVQDFPAESRKLVAACEEWGCFRIINHGIPTALMSDMHMVATALFNRPMEIKQRTVNPIADRGYIANDGGSSFAALISSAPLPSPHEQRGTMREFLYESLGLFDPASHGSIDAFCVQLELFPEQRETIMRYINAAHGLAMKIGCKLAESMGLVNCDLFKGWVCQYRLNKYNFSPQTLGRTGVPIHTDSGFLTIVQDDGRVGGLEVVDKISGNLIPVDPMPGTLLVNVGDTAKTVLRTNPYFEADYVPISGKISSDSANFPLEPLLSNSSSGGKLNVTWTYFLLDIPSGAAGGSLHIKIPSGAETNFEIYAKYGGLPSLESWDYYYANTTRSSDISMFSKPFYADDQMVSFYVLYIRGGTWSVGLRQLNTSDTASKNQTTMSISLERCPRRCSSPHGKCQSAMDASGLIIYSYCSCDRDHGGFDCSIEIVSQKGHIWQSIALIASNAAALLPAYWSFHQKAYAELVLFMCSGVSSGFYHACDVGTWCPLSYHVLQFMDFWLSFMAVVSTFVYLADIEEVSKRTIHTIGAIITALMAATRPTSPTNIALVMAIGVLGLLIGWLIEFRTKNRSLPCTAEFHLNPLNRWQAVKGWLHSLIKALLKRFRWGFVLAGFAALAMAVISLKLENSESYWIWHSVWHISIYTCSFLFLCSKVDAVDGESGGPPDGNYELTRQDSFSRG